MDAVRNLVTLLFFPGGLFVLACGLIYLWLNRKIVARLQNRIGPRWFQPAADMLKLLVKEEIVPQDVPSWLFQLLPVFGLAGALTAALYVPMAGLAAAFSFPGDLIITVYLLSLLTLCTGLAGAISANRFSLLGATRTLTQQFAYEVPFLLALLSPAIVAQSWQMRDVLAYADGRWLVLTQPLSFIVALIGVLGKLEWPPFNAPEAETEIVAGALTEYSGRGLALFHLGRAVELIVALTLIAALYLGGVGNPIEFFIKTLSVLLLLAVLETVMARLRIDQVVGVWWRYGAMLVLLQLIILVVWQGVIA